MVDDIHLAIIPGLFNLRIAIALFIQRIGAGNAADSQQTETGGQQTPRQLLGFLHKLFLVVTLRQYSIMPRNQLMLTIE